jgi:hypothetical protein
VQITLGPDDLRPILDEVVSQALVRFAQANEAAGSRLAFNEAEAAALIGLEPHQLRDERRRGRVQASVVVNRSIRYLRSDLLGYLLRNRTGGDQ